MTHINFKDFTKQLIGETVERPNKATAGTLSEHAAGEPFEKKVYTDLKKLYPNKIFKQYEYLNDIFLKHPKVITTQERYALFDSPTILFLLSRGDKATKGWNPNNIFEEKQNDTADIIFTDNGHYDFIDVKTRNLSKSAQAPNIISAYKVAQMCAKMIENEDYNIFNLNYIEIGWLEDQALGILKCINATHCELFKAKPSSLYINWAAAMQIQFHVSDLDQTWNKSMNDWCIEYLRCFIKSAKERCAKMEELYIKPFLKYIQD